MYVRECGTSYNAELVVCQIDIFLNSSINIAAFNTVTRIVILYFSSQIDIAAVEDEGQARSVVGLSLKEGSY